MSWKRFFVRVLVAFTVIFGARYVGWRWTSSMNMDAWFIAVPLVLAESYSLVDGVLFGLTVWRLKIRGAAPPPPEGRTVDVFITTYNEELDLVMATARAAKAIRYPHRTFVLDDGARDEMRAAAEAEGIGYITRSAAWANMPRHAKAGNLNNALEVTDGEFLLVLDADQIPEPTILDRTLGWFTDDRVALVQTPQYFTNVTEADPLGSQAPLFYGPIQQGKDGWNAAFFCGSNAILRREALLQLGVVGYVDEVELALRRALRQAMRILRRARKEATDPDVRTALDDVRAAAVEARRALRKHDPLSEITYRFQRKATEASRRVVASDLDGLRADLAAIAALTGGEDVVDLDLAADAVEQLAQRDWSPLGALESVQAMVRALDVDRVGEAQAVMPMATISVTEDMATAMRIHGAGWKSVYHHEILANGLAPEDLGSMLHQRLRWAQGTLQVLLRENPLTKKGLSVGQRLMYVGTMWTYLSGIAALPYLVSPILFLCFGVRPVESFGNEFLWHLVPFLALNQLLFFVVGHGVKTWRGQQYSLALFPLWIRALTTAVGNVWFGRSLGFVVTPKTRQGTHEPPWKLIRAQLVFMGLLVASAIIGLVRVAIGAQPSLQATLVNVVWVCYDLLVMSVIVDAALYRGYDVPEHEEAAA
ncbi:MAG TPA: glycosyltransferase [Acidimicrobiales bacterium]|nr:glycosyltransferase [Acidimicrobiales bacterium]